LSFVIDKKIKVKDIVQTILAADKKIIDRVELFDIYENEEKLP
jgi:phenylalanyl-tRNA synthetase beta subunit